MSESPIRKSLGELAIIVLGVLIALFAESAWNDYQDRAVGREYLGRLAAEATENLEFLKQDLSWAQMLCNSATASLAMLRAPGDEQEPAALLRSVVIAALYSNPRYQRATHDDMIGTGGLALVDDVALRAKIVGAYTDFFESLDAWRPAKDTPLRTAVIRTVPGEFINGVSAECMEFEETDSRYRPIRTKACSTAPHEISTASLFATVKAIPDLEGFLMERAWQTCEYDEDMRDSREHLQELITAIDAAAQ
jgi:hypothetical protein